MIDVLLWDYDGTLADSYKKNYAVTFEVLKKGVPRLYHNLPAALKTADSFLRAVTDYEDWRKLYTDCYGMTPEETEIAGRLWAQCQQECTVIAPLFDGAGALLEKYRQRKQGIISQNSADEIRKVLRLNALEDCVGYVCGYTDVPQFSPKPATAPFEKCVEMLGIRPAEETVVYIGDHEEDVIFTQNIRRLYDRSGNKPMRIFSVAAAYSGSHPQAWKHAPDFCADSIAQLGEILQTIDQMTND